MNIKLTVSYERNIQSNAIEICKVKNNLSTQMLSEIFRIRNIDYNLETQTNFATAHRDA